MAFLTIIMRTQGINLCDSRHIGNEGRTYGATRSNQIPILHRFPYQLLRNDIHNGKSVGNNRIQFLFQSFFYNIRQYLAIDLMRSPVADIRQRLVTVFNNRRTFIRSDRIDGIHHIRDQVCVINNYLPRFITA